MVKVERTTQKAITSTYSIPLPASNGLVEEMQQQARTDMKEYGLRPGSGDELEVDYQEGNLTASWFVTLPADDNADAEGLMAPAMANIVAGALFMAANPNDSWTNVMIPEEVKEEHLESARELLGRMSAAWPTAVTE
jgi:hypothetical protein